MKRVLVNIVAVAGVGLVTVWGVAVAEMLSDELMPPSYQIVLHPNHDGGSDLYACEEDSPPPCVWDCATMGNRICGSSW